MARVHRIAISGHRGLPSLTADLVDKAIRAGLAEWTSASPLSIHLR
jgi:hypothetical protein